MAKTLTIRLDEETYQKIKRYAEAERRPISGFLENAALTYIEETTFTDELEMMEIISNSELVSRLQKGSRQAKQKKGRFVG